MSQSAAKIGWACAAVLGALGGGVGAVLLTASIGRSTISTAALSFIALPFVMFFWAAPCAAMGFCAGYLWATRRRGGPVATFRRVVSGVVLIAIAVSSAAYVTTNLVTGWEVERTKGMSDVELERVLASKWFGANRFVLAEVAQNPRASPAILREIAMLKDPQLHQKLSSLFDIMGSNRHGLAVMRLVARHPNVDGATLEILSLSDDGYVAADVAMNPKLSDQTRRRLEQRSDPILEWALARNPKTSPSVLTRLSQSSDQYVRTNVAGNPSAAVEDLARLGHDAEFQIRRNVATNPSAPLGVRESLRHDPDARVRAVFPTR